MRRFGTGIFLVALLAILLSSFLLVGLVAPETAANTEAATLASVEGAVVLMEAPGSQSGLAQGSVWATYEVETTGSTGTVNAIVGFATSVANVFTAGLTSIVLVLAGLATLAALSLYALVWPKRGRFSGISLNLRCPQQFAPRLLS